VASADLRGEQDRVLAAGALQHEVGAGGRDGVAGFLRCDDRAEPGGAGERSTTGRALDRNHPVPRGLSQLGDEVAYRPEADHCHRVTGSRRGELQADAADLAEAGKGRDVGADPGRQRQADMLPGVEAHHALVRGVRENARSDREAAVESGGKDSSGHSVARMERLVRAPAGRAQIAEGVAAIMG
jgi:hypothetical protein